MAHQLFTGPLLALTKQSLSLGKNGENLAAEFLKQNGYRILAKNFRTKLGELDIVALDKGTVCFIEVKTRLGDKKGKPYEAINKRKIIHLKRAANYYLLINNYKQYKLSLDAISIVLDNDLNPIKIDHFENIEI